MVYDDIYVDLEILCITHRKDGLLKDHLTVGEWYRATKESYFEGEWYYIIWKDDKGYCSWHRKDLFKTISEVRDRTLKELLE